MKIKTDILEIVKTTVTTAGTLSEKATIPYSTANNVLYNLTKNGYVTCKKIGKVKYYQWASSVINNDAISVTNPGSYNFNAGNFNVTITTTGNKTTVQTTQTAVKPYTGPTYSVFEKQDYKQTWGIEYLDLVAECADFYVLNDYLIDHPNDSYVKSMFDNSVKFLSKQFSNYLDMAIGGEMRHAKKFGSYFKKYYITKEYISRHGAWNRWKFIRETEGLKALEKASDCFHNDYWPGAYGGPKWGKCTDVLLRYLKSEDNAVMFVDTAWSLEHNGGCVFNKAWNTLNIGEILDMKFDGNIAGLKKYCRGYVRDAVNGK